MSGDFVIKNPEVPGDLTLFTGQRPDGGPSASITMRGRDGAFLVNGNVVTNDRAVYEAFRDFIFSTRPGPWTGYTLESVSGLRHRLIHILRRAAAGETFVITVRGRPIARVCPLRENVEVKS